MISFSDAWALFAFSFLVALTGALAPGPLLTYTIVTTLHTRKRGYLTGAWIISGHAILESGIIIALLLGLAALLKNPVVVKIVGIVGGCFLLYMGGSLLLDVYRRKVPDLFTVHRGGSAEVTAAPTASSTAVPTNEAAATATAPSFGIKNPVLGGVLISMSNPYFWVWWATVGFAFMIQFDVSFTNWPALVIFFLGHEAGDLAWYFGVSIAVDAGKQKLSRRMYSIILVVCGIGIIFFGFYLGISLFFK